MELAGQAGWLQFVLCGVEWWRLLRAELELSALSEAAAVSQTAACVAGAADGSGFGYMLEYI